MGLLRMDLIRNCLLTTVCSITFSLAFANESITSPSIASESGWTTSNELDVEVVSFLNEFSKILASTEGLFQREIIKEIFYIPKDQIESIERIDKVVLGRHGSINVRLFSPKCEGYLPIIIYFYRGGWCYGNIEENEAICKKLANETGSIVAIIEHSMFPECKLPIPLEECYDATKWIVENAPTFLGDPNKVILCGEGVGGDLAAEVALMVLNTKEFTVAGKLLIYPVMTSDLIWFKNIQK